MEAQQADAADKSAKHRTKLSPAAAAQVRDRENLRLARQRVLQQIETAQNPRHRESLQQALADLDEKLNSAADIEGNG